MFDFRKLEGRIIEKYKTRIAFAAAMGLNPSALSARLNGKISFQAGEIVKAQELLQIAPEEIGAYFFTPKV